MMVWTALAVLADAAASTVFLARGFRRKQSLLMCAGLALVLAMATQVSAVVRHIDALMSAGFLLGTVGCAIGLLAMVTGRNAVNR